MKKTGLELTERLDIRSHNPCENLEYLGLSSLRIPIWVNRDFMRADLAIGPGIIMPRGRSFGGGSKIVLPGVCGRETISANRNYCPSALFTEHTQEVQARSILFCPGVNAAEVRLLYGDQYLFCKTWDQVLAVLEQRHGAAARVCGAHARRDPFRPGRLCGPNTHTEKYLLSRLSPPH